MAGHGVRVTLTAEEWNRACVLGTQRDDEARATGHHHKVKAADTSRDYQLQIHIEGVAGEMAFCKAAGVPFPATINTYRDQPDVPPDIEVRTRSKHWHDLIVRTDDNPEYRVVLVTGSRGRYFVRGWILARAARRDEWWQTYGGGPGAWFVPQDALMPMWFGDES